MDSMIDISQANKIARDYVCAVCWGFLRVVNFDRITRTAEIKCANENCSGSGFHSKRYAELKKAESRMERLDFDRICGPAIGIEKKPVDVDNLINEMWG